jgi:putative oxidoreductase
MAGTSTFSAQSQSTHSQSVALPAVAAPVALLGRVLFALIFLMAAPMNFSGKTIAFAASQGVPLASISVPLSGIIALAGGFSIVLFLAAVTPMLHSFWAVTDPMMHQMQFIMFMKNLSMLGGALFISQVGAGPWSLDARRK